MSSRPPTTRSEPIAAQALPAIHAGEPGSAPLTSRKRERFAQLIAQGFTQSDAYRQAFDTTTDRPTTVWATAATTAADPLVSARIDYLRRDIAAHDQAAFYVTRSRVLAEIARIALADPRRLLDEQGKPLPLHKLPDDIAAAVEQVDILTGPDGQPTAWRYKLARKTAASDQLARMLGMYAADNRQRADSLADALARLADQTGTGPSLAARLIGSDGAAPEPSIDAGSTPDGPERP